MIFVKKNGKTNRKSRLSGLLTVFFLLSATVTVSAAPVPDRVSVTGFTEAEATPGQEIVVCTGITDSDLLPEAEAAPGQGIVVRTGITDSDLFPETAAAAKPVVHLTPKGDESEKTDSERSGFSKFKLPKIDLPKIDFSKIDKEAEKQKLREALQALDEKGMSPEKLAERLWQFVTRRENKEKPEQAAEGIRESAGELTGKDTSSDASDVKRTETSAEETGTSTERTESSAAGSTKEIDRITRTITDKASEEIEKAADSAADKAAEAVKETVSREIDSAAEDLKDSLHP